MINLLKVTQLVGLGIELILAPEHTLLISFLKCPLLIPKLNTSCGFGGTVFGSGDHRDKTVRGEKEGLI